MKNLLIASTALIALTAAASAADMAPRTYSKAPPMVSPMYNWSGFYIGAMGGYGWSDRVTSGNAAFATSEINGGFGGGQVGYNWQAPGSQFVFGIEVDAAWSDIKYRETVGIVTFEDRIQSFGSVTGRLGYAVNSALFYAKGGYAWADNKVSVSTPAATLFSESKFHSGWTVGGGVEYGFTPNWSIKGEYMYASYQDENYLAALAPGGVNLGLDVHTVKGGINYRFGGGY